MAELLEGGRCGVLVDPYSPGELSAGIKALLDDSAMRQRLAVRARERVVSSYAPEALLKRYEEGYQLAIDRRNSRDGRISTGVDSSVSSAMPRA
jgi:glycosyltransferase involved in cell wall biosynthesis